MLAGVACALAQTIEQLTVLRMLHGLSAAAVVINALMRDTFAKDEFSRMMSFVMLAMTVAPLLAPMLGGVLLLWFSWHAIFWTLAGLSLIASVLVMRFVKESLPVEKRQPFHFHTTAGNFASLFRHKKVFSYMVASGFSFSGMFSFLSAGPFVYIDLYGVSPQHFGYYFALNVVFPFLTTYTNSRVVRRLGANQMFRIGLLIQFVVGIALVVIYALDLGFLPLVLGVAIYVGCVAMVMSNAMAVILDDFPHMAGCILASWHATLWHGRTGRKPAVTGEFYQRLADDRLHVTLFRCRLPALRLRSPLSLIPSLFSVCRSDAANGTLSLLTFNVGLHYFDLSFLFTVKCYRCHIVFF